MTTIQGAKAPTLDLCQPVLAKQQLAAMEKPIPAAVFDQLDEELKVHAEKLAKLKREADEAEAAYKTAREAMEAEFAAKHADVIDAKKRAAANLMEVDTNARLLLEALASVLGSGKVIGGLYTIETRTAPEVTNPTEFIRWIVTNAPVLAPTLLAVNTTAVNTFVTQFSESDVDEETGEPIRRLFAPFNQMPIYTGTRYVTRIEWTAIKRAYPVIEAEQPKSTITLNDTGSTEIAQNTPAATPVVAVVDTGDEIPF